MKVLFIKLKYILTLGKEHIFLSDQTWKLVKTARMIMDLESLGEG